MNSEEDVTHIQTKIETRTEGNLSSNENQLVNQSVSPKILKIQNKVITEQVKLNNNECEIDTNCTLTAKSLTTNSNDSKSVQSDELKCSNILNQETNQDLLNINASPISLSASKSQIGITNAVCQSKQKTVPCTNSLNLSKPHMHINLSSNSIYSSINHTPGPYMVNSTASVSNQSILPQNSCIGKFGEDVDMKNNVDYLSEIEKCPPKVSCSSDSSPEIDQAWMSRAYNLKCILNNISGSIGSMSQGTCCFLRPNINGSKEVPGPSGLQKNFQRDLVERRDSSSGNEGDLSDGEDYCIYTYKGNDDVSHNKEECNQEQGGDHEAEEQNHSGRSSPEMDFLEMDFDPGPSCEQDTGDSDLASINEDIQNIALDNVEADPVLNDLSSGKVISRQATVTVPQNPKENGQNVRAGSPQPGTSSQSNEEDGTKRMFSSSWLPSNNTTEKWEKVRQYRSSGCPLRESYGYHSTSGDLISPGDNRDSDPELWTESSVVHVAESINLNSRKINLSSTLYHRMMAKKLMLDKQAAFNQSSDSNLESELCNERLNGLLPVEKVMLWSEQEATIKQVTQVGTSACGATSAINAMLALDVSFSAEVLMKGVATKLREQGAPLPQYLLSRSLAGATHKDIIRGINLSTNGLLVAKFFAFYPERKVSLSHWLHYWISKGAAPIATLNLQHCGEGCDIPDAWHHQMIFGVGPAGIYLTNPLQCLPEKLVWHQLVSPSVLLVRKSDVLAHWNAKTDLTPLAAMNNKWRKMNVLGQVVNMVREAMCHRRQANHSSTGTTHIRIPALYKTGITLVVRADSPAAAELSHAEQLPLL